MDSQYITKHHKAYVTLAAIIFGAICLFTLGINSAIDPLWYFHGNQLTNKNLVFNEREAKLNQLRRDPTSYDCLILGSSRTTWLRASSLAPYKCFNLSFSSGQIEEFIVFAKYALNEGLRPKLVIVGVDGFNFLITGRDTPSIPEFVKKMESPPTFLKSYLTLDSLLMSWRTLREDFRSPSYYDRHFQKTVRTDIPPFRPENGLNAEGLARADAEERRKIKYQSNNAPLYGKLATLFPDAHVIAYVPPISAWHVADMAKNDVLQGYLDAIYDTSAYFSVFVDFSIPSAITSRTDNTYDGSHYLPIVNSTIAEILLSEPPPSWGINLKQLDRRTYIQYYTAALSEFKPRGRQSE